MCFLQVFRSSNYAYRGKKGRRFQLCHQFLAVFLLGQDMVMSQMSLYIELDLDNHYRGYQLYYSLNIHFFLKVNLLTFISCLNVGPIHNIGSSFSGFTADQWKNWTLINSPVALKSILPSASLNCWLRYVRACSILCARSIKTSSVATADLFLENFCKKFVELYGSLYCISILNNVFTTMGVVVICI